MSVNLEKAVLNRALTEVVHSTRRVKSDDRSTLHPVVEGIVTVAESIARDAHSILTVSVADPTTPESLFYSVPCTQGRQGLVHRHTEAIGDPSVEEKLTTCKQALIHTLQNTTSDF
jgi:malate/lactate dehydrogenase